MNPDEQFYFSSDTWIDCGTEIFAGVDPGVCRPLDHRIIDLRDCLWSDRDSGRTHTIPVRAALAVPIPDAGIRRVPFLSTQ